MKPNQIVLYTGDIEASKAFYQKVLDTQPQGLSPNFAVFPLDNGWTLGILRRETVQPEPAPAGGVELILERPNRESVDQVAATWRKDNVSIILEPTEAPFGYSFIAADPDGHRLRVGYFPQG